MIRKKGLIYVIIAVVLIAVFDFFFLDMLVKGAIIGAGERVFRAKVEISKLHVDLSKSRITIQGVAVGDSKNALKNLFEIEKISLDIKLLPALKKKTIIDDVSVLNLALGTERKIPGLLSQSKLDQMDKEDKDSPAGKAYASLKEKASKEITQIPAAKLAGFADMKNSDCGKSIKKEDLTSYKKIIEANSNIKSKKEDITASISKTDISARVKTIQAKIDSAKSIRISNIKEIPEAQKKLQELEEAKKELDELNAGIKAAKAKAEDFYSYTANLKKEVNDAKQQDIDNAINSCGINAINGDNLAKGLVGPIWYGRVETMLSYLKLADKYVIKKKKKGKDKILEKKRAHGRDIIFSWKAEPDFWIKKVAISTKEAAVDKYMMSGTITDICLEQSEIGKPMALDLAMKKGTRAITVKGQINRIEGTKDSIQVAAANMPGDFFSFDKVNYGNIKIEKSTVDMSAGIKNTEEALSINGEMFIKNLVFAGADKEDIALQALKTIDAMKIFFTVKVKEGKTDTNISTDIADRIKKNLSKIYGKKLDEIKAKVSKNIEGIVRDEAGKLEKNITGSNSEVGGIVNGYTKEAGGANSSLDAAKKSIEKKISDQQSKGAKDFMKGLIK